MIQTRAARLIIGAFRATSIPALDIEVYILLVKYLLNKLSNKTVLRLAASLLYNDIIKPRSEQWKSKRRPRKDRKISLLERHTRNFEARHGNITKIERLRPFSVSLEWTLPTTIIAESKKEVSQLARDSINAGYTIVYITKSKKFISTRIPPGPPVQ